MKTMNLFLIVSALFFVIVISFVQCPEPEDKEIKTEIKPTKEINYITKAKIANNSYIKDYNPEAKTSLLFTDEHGELLIFDYIKGIYEDADENYEYVYLTNGNFTIGNNRYYYESIIEIERGNKNATYGISGIDIIYFQIFED